MSDEPTIDASGDDAPTTPATTPSEVEPEITVASEVGSPPADLPPSDPAASPGAPGRGWIWGGVAVVAAVALIVGAYFVGRSSVSEGPSSLAEAAQQTAKGELPVGELSLGELGQALGGSNGDILEGLDDLGGKGAGGGLLDGLLDELSKQLERGLNDTDDSDDSSSTSTQAFLGVSATNAPNQSGAQVSVVAPNSPAADAGIQAGDVITAIDGTAVTSASRLASSVAAHAPGDVVTVTYSRNGARADARVRLGNTSSATTPTTTTSPAI